MSPVQTYNNNNIQSTNNMPTSTCVFYDTNTDTSFTHDIPTNTRVDNMYDTVRSTIGCPFDLVVKSHGKHGVSLNKNLCINLSNNFEFYVRKYTINECLICMTEQSMVTIPGCSHTICLHCHERVESCPYCRTPFNRTIINP